MNRSEKSRVKRVPKRGHYDYETINRILDEHFTCHIGFIHDGYPVVIPTLYGRKDNTVLIHGATVSRMITNLENGLPISLSVHSVNGIVIARSAFHHSVNYQSVVLFGNAVAITDDEKKMTALKAISDHVIKGRWEEARIPNSQELKATTVLEISIEEASAKIRTGGPVDDEADYDLDVWAGVIPIHRSFGTPIPDKRMSNGIALPNSVANLLHDH